MRKGYEKEREEDEEEKRGRKGETGGVMRIEEGRVEEEEDVSF